MPTSTTRARAPRASSIDASQVLAARGERQAAQPVVSAELDDHDVRLVQLEHARQPGKSALRWFRR